MAQQINLYSPIFLKREKHFSVRAMGYGLAVLAAGVAAFYGYAWREHQALARAVQGNDARVAEQRTQYAKLAQQLLSDDARKGLEAEAERLDGEVARRRKLLDALHAGVFGGTEGVSSYFAALARRALPGVWLTGVAIGEGADELTLTGGMSSAELAPSYLRALAEEPVLRGRRVTELQLRRKETPGAAQAAGRTVASARYLEFTLAAPRRVRDAPAKPEKGSP
jgi:hypothetical protein